VASPSRLFISRKAIGVVFNYKRECLKLDFVIGYPVIMFFDKYTDIKKPAKKLV